MTNELTAQAEQTSAADIDDAAERKDTIPEYVFIPALLTFDHAIETVGPICSNAYDANEWIEIEIEGRRWDVLSRVVRLPLGGLRNRIAKALTAH